MALRRSDDDLLDGILQHTPLVWADALREAERLGEAHLTETGARSGDLLHVASAVVLGAREFVTFDQRQTALARRAGLRVKTWKSRK
jgi:predicted nucleic acid-binding protein